MKITCIGSGSSGNCFYVESDKGTGVFLDAGCSYKQISQHDIKVAGKPFFVTHEHGDHSKYASELFFRYGALICGTEGTMNEVTSGGTRLTNGTEYTYCGIREDGIEYEVDYELIPVIHNAVDPCCFYIEVDGENILYITDTGTIPEVRHLRPDVLIVEANYTAGLLYQNAINNDNIMLAAERISSDAGHLSAIQASKITWPMLDSLDLLIFCHISRRNFSVEEFYESRSIPEAVKDKADFAFAGSKWNTIPF